MRQVRKTNAKSLVVRTCQRTAAQQVDVVVDDHQVARLEPGIDAAGGVRQDERLYAKGAQRTSGKRHRSQIVPLAEMRAA